MQDEKKHDVVPSPKRAACAREIHDLTRRGAILPNQEKAYKSGRGGSKCHVSNCILRIPNGEADSAAWHSSTSFRKPSGTRLSRPL